jgi:malonyl-CoA O-methyltransferase
MQAEHRADEPCGHRLDAAALARTIARLSAAGQAPWLHEEAARRMAERLPLVKLQPQRVLDWSGPLGGSERLLQQAYPQALQQFVAAAGAPSVAPVRGGLARWWPWRLAARQALAAAEAEPGTVQLLWSNMLLHAVDDPTPLLAQWQRALATGGFLMFSTLGPGTLPELRDLYRDQGWGEPMAPFIDMHDLGDMLVRAGFADPVMDQEQVTLTWPDTLALQGELRGLGANVSPRRHAGLRTPRWRQRLLAALGAKAVDGRPSLSFELVYGHAFKAAPRAPVQAEARVSLEDMRTQLRHGKPSPT